MTTISFYRKTCVLNLIAKIFCRIFISLNYIIVNLVVVLEEMTEQGTLLGPRMQLHPTSLNKMHLLVMPDMNSQQSIQLKQINKQKPKTNKQNPNDNPLIFVMPDAKAYDQLVRTLQRASHNHDLQRKNIHKNTVCGSLNLRKHFLKPLFYSGSSICLSVWALLYPVY